MADLQDYKGDFIGHLHFDNQYYASSQMAGYLQNTQQVFDQWLLATRNFIDVCNQGCYDCNHKHSQRVIQLVQNEFYNGALIEYFRALKRYQNAYRPPVIVDPLKKSGIVNETIILPEYNCGPWDGLPYQTLILTRDVPTTVAVDYSNTEHFYNQVWDDYDLAMKNMLAKWKECMQFLLNDPLDKADVQDGFVETGEKYRVTDPEYGAFVFFARPDAPINDDWDIQGTGPFTVTIPTDPALTYNYSVNWGDGTPVQTGITGDVTHTYTTFTGTESDPFGFEIIVTGDFPRIYFNNHPEAYKVTVVNQWGNTKWQTMADAFRGCRNLVWIATQKVPDLSECTSLARMFSGCIELTTPFELDLWDVSNVSDISEMFKDCMFFDTPIGKWNVSSVTNAAGFLDGALNYETNIENYDDLLLGWTGWNGTTATKTVQSGVTFGIANGRHSNCPDIIAAKNYLQTTKGWTINDNGDTGLCGSLPEEIFYKITIDTERITGDTRIDDCAIQPAYSDAGVCNSFSVASNFPVIYNDGTTNRLLNQHISGFFTARRWHIDWGDGRVHKNLLGTHRHHYETPGQYQIRIWGNMQCYGNSSGVDANASDQFHWREQNKVVSIDQWGTSIRWRKFRKFSHLDISAVGRPVQYPFQLLATDVPDLSRIIPWPNSNSAFPFGNPNMEAGLADAFSNSETFVGAPSMNTWDTSRCTSLAATFHSCMSFDGSFIDQWDVSNVVDIHWTFGSASVGTQCPITTENYCDILLGWTGWQNGAPTKPVQANPAGTMYINAQYCDCPEVVGARNYLISQGWNIVDLGNSGVCPRAAFTMTIDTTISGASAEDTMILPATGTYDIDWGDGTIDVGVTGNQTHVYGTPGKYKIRITGGLEAIQFANSGDKDKVLTIDQWGEIEWTTMEGAFHGASNMDVIATDTPNLDGVTNFNSMFEGATSLTAPSIKEMAICGGSSTSMQAMFKDAINFNEDIGTWQVGQVTNMTSMFEGATSFNQDLTSWIVRRIGSEPTNFATGSGLAPANKPLWGTDGATFQPFIFTVDSSSPYFGLAEVPVLSSQYSYLYDVDWGDGSPLQTNLTTSVTHNYGAAGIYTIKIYGVFPRLAPWNDNFTSNHSYGFHDKIRSVEQWGTIEWEETMKFMFFRADDMVINATDAPDLRCVKSLEYMLARDYVAGKPTVDPGNNINTWDVRTIENTRAMFRDNLSFNSPLNNWDTRNLRNANNMFAQSNITSLGAFNQSLNSWNTSKLEDTSSMFYYKTGYNQPFDNWDTRSLKNANFMFYFCQVLDQNFSSWDVSNLYEAWGMFSVCLAFNNAGDPGISNWNTSNLELAISMFRYCDNFNQDIGQWDVSNVTNMAYMLQGCDVFNQDLGNWDISAVGTSTNPAYTPVYLWLEFFAQGAPLSQANYDSLLIGWTGWSGGLGGSPSKTVPASPFPGQILFSVANTTNYTLGGDAEGARNYLLSLGWNISDGGGV